MNDLILDVKHYQFIHPGGQFLVEKNVGRDIGKYFDGGYQMENSNK
jgi:cytochrome b involved in lipid metabolism